MHTLSDLAHIAVALNEVSDKLSQDIAGLEAELKKLNIGVQAWVWATEQNTGNRYGYTQFEDHTWGLAVLRNGEKPIPVRRARRPERLQCWILRDKIINAIGEVAIKLTRKIEMRIEDDGIPVGSDTSTVQTGSEDRAAN